MKPHLPIVPEIDGKNLQIMLLLYFPEGLPIAQLAQHFEVTFGTELHAYGFLSLNDMMLSEQLQPFVRLFSTGTGGITTVHGRPVSEDLEDFLEPLLPFPKPSNKQFSRRREIRSNALTTAKEATTVTAATRRPYGTSKSHQQRCKVKRARSHAKLVVLDWHDYSTTVDQYMNRNEAKSPDVDEIWNISLEDAFLTANHAAYCNTRTLKLMKELKARDPEEDPDTSADEMKVISREQAFDTANHAASCYVGARNLNGQMIKESNAFEHNIEMAVDEMSLDLVKAAVGDIDVKIKNEPGCSETNCCTSVGKIEIKKVKEISAVSCTESDEFIEADQVMDSRLEYLQHLEHYYPNLAVQEAVEVRHDFKPEIDENKHICSKGFIKRLD